MLKRCLSLVIALLLPAGRGAVAVVPMPGDRVPVYSTNYMVDSIGDGLDAEEPFLFEWYDRISDKYSIHRCMFSISCSYYARRAIREKGFFPGLIYSLDRYFYRENIASSRFYSHIRREGRILLDDAFFLGSEQ